MVFKIKKLLRYVLRQRMPLAFGMFFILWMGGGYYYFVYHRANLSNIERKLDKDDYYQKQAIEAANEPVPSDPQEAVAYYSSLGDSLSVAKKFDLAIEAYNKAEQIDKGLPQPSSFDYNLKMAEMYTLWGKEDKVKYYYELELNYRKSHPEIYNSTLVNDLEEWMKTNVQ